MFLTEEKMVLSGLWNYHFALDHYPIMASMQNDKMPLQPALGTAYGRFDSWQPKALGCEMETFA